MQQVFGDVKQILAPMSFRGLNKRRKCDSLATDPFGSFNRGDLTLEEYYVLWKPSNVKRPLLNPFFCVGFVHINVF